MESMAGLGSNSVMVNPSTDLRHRPAGRAYGGLSPEDRVAARRARLVQAGAELFGIQGLRATTVRGVCAEAGLTDRYFYESFTSLEDLLAAVYTDMMDGLRRRLQALPPWPAQVRGAAVDWAAVERRCSAGYGAWFDAVSDTRFARVVLAEVLGVNAELDALYEAHTQDFAAHTTAPLAGLRLSAERRTLIGRALVGAAVQVAKHWAGSAYAAPRRAVVRTCVLVALGTLRELTTERDDP
jgi:AcrR family transcriptional regulator